MNRYRNTFRELADQAGRGDLAAGAKLRQQLEPQLVHIVRLALRDPKPSTTLHRRIRAEANRLGFDGDLASNEDRERLIRKVAHSVCASVVADLGSRPRAGHMANETVCTASSSV